MSSYTTSANVGSIVPRYATSSGDFDSTSTPTDTVVDRLITEVSAVVDMVLSQNGFAVPVTDTDALNMLQMFVTDEVAAIVEGINGSGRFGPTTKQPHRQGRFRKVLSDVQDFVDQNSIGLERVIGSRSQPEMFGIYARTTNLDGDEATPLFTRGEFSEPQD